MKKATSPVSVQSDFIPVYKRLSDFLTSHPTLAQIYTMVPVLFV